MTENKDPVRVQLYVHTGLVGAEHHDEIEIPRDEWNEMTPAERRKQLDDEAQTLLWNHIDYGWSIDDADDNAATEGGAR